VRRIVIIERTKRWRDSSQRAGHGRVRRSDGAQSSDRSRVLSYNGLQGMMIAEPALSQTPSPSWTAARCRTIFVCRVSRLVRRRCIRAATGSRRRRSDGRGRAFQVHAQTTFVTQSHAGFPAAYSGAKQLTFSIRETKIRSAPRCFWGRSYGRGRALLLSEVIKGRGLSNVLGIAGFPNGDVARVGEGAVRFYHARLFLRQTSTLGKRRSGRSGREPSCARITRRHGSC